MLAEEIVRSKRSLVVSIVIHYSKIGVLELRAKESNIVMVSKCYCLINQAGGATQWCEPMQ